MFNNSRYRAIIKNEQRKVRATTGLCCSSSVCCNDTEADKIDNIVLLSRTLTDNGNCGSVSIDDSVLNSRTAANNIDMNSNPNIGFCGQNNRSFRDAGNNYSTRDEPAELVNAIRIQAEAEAAERDNRRRNSRNRAIRNRNGNPARAGNTNVYRFVNQNFLNNALGRANVRISDLNVPQTRRERQQEEEIENILRRYGRNCNYRR